MRKVDFSIIVGAFAILVGCEDNIPQKFETEKNLISIGDYLYDNEGMYSDFIRLIEATNMKDALSAYNPLGNKYTLFLPDNNAFNNFFELGGKFSSMDELLADIDFSHELSRYHVVNSAITTNNFPFGALSDTSLTGDFLVISYIEGEDSTYFKVNNHALVQKGDMEMSNGIVHVIDKVLEPVTFSGYDWLKSNAEYSIIVDLFELTGLKDTLGIYVYDINDKIRENRYTLLVEADSIFNKSGIYSINDLIDMYSPGDSDYTLEDNSLFQFAAYHIVEDSWYLADLLEGTSNYNTYASLPLQIRSGADIRINPGVKNFDSIYVETDSSYIYIDYLNVFVNQSNVQTKNGPIHFINRVMDLYKPNRTRRVFEFYEEPMINRIKNVNQRHVFNSPEEFSVIQWSGVDELIWEKNNSTTETALNKDFIEVDGDFTISYRIPKILPGIYGLQLRINTNRRSNATIQIYLDGKKIGGNLNLTSGGLNANIPYRIKNIGIVEFNKYEEHTLVIRSLIPGKFTWDYVRFENSISDYNNNKQ